MDYPAVATTRIDATPDKVWAALTRPDLVSQVMFGAEVVTDWQVGGPIVYRGQWEGRPFEDKGTVLEFEPEHLLRTTHYSPLSGLEDTPENYHTVSYELAADKSGGTVLTVTQTNNPTQFEATKAAQNWSMMLDHLKEVVAGI